MEATYYIVEIPYQYQPAAWKGDRDYIIHVAKKMSERRGGALYTKTTAREQLAINGYASLEEARAGDDNFAADYLGKLVDRFGLDTVIYHTFGETDDWQTAPVDELDCALNYIGHDLNSLKVFCSVEEARKAIADGVFNCHQGVRARAALENILPHIKE